MPNFYLSPIDSNVSAAESGVFIQGIHNPSTLVRSSGIWIEMAGSAILQQPEYKMGEAETPIWLVVEEGSVVFESQAEDISLKKDECVVIPASTANCSIKNAREARLLWFTLNGPLTSQLMEELNVSSKRPIRQGVLPGMVQLIRQIVQVMVRHSGTGDSSYQLQRFSGG